MTDKIIDAVSSTMASFWIHLVLDGLAILAGVTFHNLNLALLVLTTVLSIECIQLEILISRRQNVHHDAIKRHIDNK